CIFHAHYHVRGSIKSFWPLVVGLRGMSVEEALIQLDFQQCERAVRLKRLLRETTELALSEYNVQFRSELWIEKLNATKARYLKGIRYSMKGFHQTKTHYSHLFVKLTEGDKPEHYYKPEPCRTELASDYYDAMYYRQIQEGL
ncbi:MAG: 54S ribosomal protein L22, mitochondrial, partial [Marteilia pararefringens]